MTRMRNTGTCLGLAGCLAVIAGCGFLRVKVLEPGSGRLATFEIVDFRARNSPYDLVRPSLDASRDEIRKSRTCYGEASRAAQHFASFDQTSQALDAVLAEPFLLPPQLPSFPSKLDRDRALRARGAKVTAPLPDLASSLTLAVSPPLFVSARSAWDATPTIPGFRLLRTPTALSPFAPGGSTAPGEVVVATPAAGSVSLRSFYARSLHPEQPFQYLLQCARYRNPSSTGGPASRIWPRVAIYETGTGSLATQRVVEIRPALFLEMDNATFSPRILPLLTEDSRRREDAIKVQLGALTADGAGSARSFVWDREAKDLFLSRLIAVEKSPLAVSRSWTSHQAGVNKVSMEASQARTSTGDVVEFTPEQQQLFETGSREGTVPIVPATETTTLLPLTPRGPDCRVRGFDDRDFDVLGLHPVRNTPLTTYLQLAPGAPTPTLDEAVLQSQCEALFAAPGLEGSP